MLVRLIDLAHVCLDYDVYVFVWHTLGTFFSRWCFFFLAYEVLVYYNEVQLFEFLFMLSFDL